MRYWIIGVIALTALLALLFLSRAFGGEIALEWKPGAPSDGNWPRTFKIYRRTIDTSFELLTEIDALVLNPDGTLKAVVSSAIDATVLLGQEYCYKVSAANTVGESATTNEACAASVDGSTIALRIPQGRTALISRRYGDTSSLISILVNKSDDVAINDSVAAPGSNVSINVKGKTMLTSKRVTDGSSLIPLLVNHSQKVFINGVEK